MTTRRPIITNGLLSGPPVGAGGLAARKFVKRVRCVMVQSILE
jgi:hypothetical protein